MNLEKSKMTRNFTFYEFLSKDEKKLMDSIEAEFYQAMKKNDADSFDFKNRFYDLHLILMKIRNISITIDGSYAQEDE